MRKHTRLVFTNNMKNYPEDFGKKGGCYGHHCNKCELYFRGHIKRVTCKECFIENPEPKWAKFIVFFASGFIITYAVIMIAWRILP